MSVKKAVSKKYAQSEFRTIGLVLILYCLLVLFVPMCLKELFDIVGFEGVLGFDGDLLISLVCLIVGTLIPFFMLKLKYLKDTKLFIRTYLPFKYHLVNFLTFFTLSASAVFLTMMLGQYVNVSGELVSSIGISINTEYMDNILYIISFVFVSSILEEYAFRGVLLNCLSRYGKHFAVYISALIYALAHGSFVEMIPAFIMAIMLNKLTLCYKSLWPSVVCHVLFNFLLLVLFIIPEKYVLYTAIGLGVILVLTIVFVLTGVYRNVRIKRSDSTTYVSIMFLTTISVFVALMLFVCHSILLIMI